MKVPDHLYVLGDIYMSHVNKVQPIRIKICDMYMCRVRHINDPVLSSLKMEGKRLPFLHAAFYLKYLYSVEPVIMFFSRENAL
jgi:hypothetical protein